MALPKLSKPKAPASFRKARAPSAVSGEFPLPKYLSLLGLQAVLLAFSVVVLPRGDLPFALSAPRTKTSADRPEWEWVAYLSRDPLAFALWACGGAAVVSVWWAAELGKLVQDQKDWARATSATDETAEEAVKRKTEASGKRLKVRRWSLALCSWTSSCSDGSSGDDRVARRLFVPVTSSSALGPRRRQRTAPQEPHLARSCSLKELTLPVPAPPLQSLKDAVLSTLVVTPILFVFLLLLGAPIPSFAPLALQTQAATLALALFLATLCAFVPVSVLGAPDLLSEGAQGGSQRWMWVRLFVERECVPPTCPLLFTAASAQADDPRPSSPARLPSLKSPYERALVYPPLGALAGAWLGALPLALDWDRPWQAWPITPILGATVGYIVGGGWSAGKAGLEALARSLADEQKKAQ